MLLRNERYCAMGQRYCEITEGRGDCREALLPSYR